jgi:hypothetical protein
MKVSTLLLSVALSTTLSVHWVNADDFQKSVLPVLKERCNTCHSTEKQKGDLDLERFTSLAEIKKEPMIWEGVLEQIEMGEMPPKKEKQLSAEQKTSSSQTGREARWIKSRSRMRAIRDRSCCGGCRTWNTPTRCVI